MLKQILAAAAVFVFAGMVMSAPASAADRLTVKDSDSAVKFKVGDDGTLAQTGSFTSNLASYNMVDIKNNGLNRYFLRADGISDWYLHTGTQEGGRILYATPSGGPGIIFVTYDTGTGTYINRTNFVNYGTLLSLHYHALRGLPTFNISSAGKVGVDSIAPTQKLEVNGGFRLFPQQVVNNYQTPAVTTPAPTRPNCDASAEGTMWYQPKSGSTGGVLSLCGQSGAAAFSWFTLKAF